MGADGGLSIGKMDALWETLWQLMDVVGAQASPEVENVGLRKRSPRGD
jgi:hypothetical protein